MLGHKVVEGGINGSGSQSVGDGKKQERGKIGGYGVAQKGHGGEKHAENRHSGGAEPAGKAVGKKGGQGAPGASPATRNPAESPAAPGL